MEKLLAAIRSHPVDGYLLADFRRRDELAYQLLGLPPTLIPTRRWFYLIPKAGQPIKLVSRVEPAVLDSLPGHRLEYSGWAELREKLAAMVTGKTIAMNYSPNADIPTVSYADAGTVELVRASGGTVVSSAALVVSIVGVLTQPQIDSHIRASRLVDEVRAAAFAYIASGGKTEFQTAQFINDRFAAAGLTNEAHGPIVAVNAHAADPHFEPQASDTRPIQPGDAILIDLWAKEKAVPNAVYYDITWCGHWGKIPPAPYQHIFNTGVAARDAAIDLVFRTFAAGQPLRGCDVDDACRAVIDRAGLGQYFVHRTGHAIDHRTHGAGVNMDNLETHDTRPILPGACFSIEPGIYQPPFGIRTEINILVALDGRPQIHGQVQRELVLL
jgi:Xaa-Pro aminopeptidase